MGTTAPAKERNLDGYGAPQIEWSRVRDRLDKGFTQAPDEGGPNRHTCWLATTNIDGSPHVVPLGAMWVDGAYYFVSGPGTRKSRNVEADPRCAVTVAGDDFDLVIEGTATKVTDDTTLQRLAAVYSDWGPTVRDGAFYHEFSAPSAGPPPWHLYVVVPSTIFAFGTAEPYGATRFDF